ncbi:MAG: prepilin-type N-terminal cleavage/methylation domain-containing protein [Nitrospirae bacterium]|nr:prepilin-type N-terminal cleavage/methylation domain-containing protein [Nitrospirota bacterium]MCL5285122.1 prepilin-type N-terminal cleavage/methylation domain-containing protein [Nitrospirota bacterium]
MIERPSPSSGFTLLEIMVVLFLVTLVALIIGPKLSFHKPGDLAKTTREIVGEVRELQWRAISTQRMVRLDYDLDRGRISASEVAPSGNLISLVGAGLKAHDLPKGITLSEVMVLHEGKVHDGKTFTQFFPSGAVESTTIFLSGPRGDRMTIVIRPLTGRIHVYPGEYRAEKMPPFYGPPSGEIPSLEDALDQ